MEAIGKAQIQMRDAPEPQVVLELALVRSTRLDLDDSPAALAERLSRIEQRMADGGMTTPATSPAPEAVPVHQPRSGSAAEAAIATAKAAAAVAERSAPTSKAPPVKPSEKPSLGAIRRQQAADEATVPVESQALALQPEHITENVPEPAAPSHPAGQASAPLDLDALNEAWKVVHATLPVKAKAILAIGRFVAVADTGANFALPNAAHVDRANECVPTMAGALAAHLGHPLHVTLVVGEEPSNDDASDDAHSSDDSAEAFASLVEESKSAGDIGSLATNKIFDAFPGSIEVTD